MHEAKANRPGNGQRGGVLIYVVDDEPMLLELTSAILEPHGYRVETFNSPDTALRAFQVAESPPALIITDFTMQTMSGLDLVEACRKLRPGQKAVLVTGTIEPDILHGAPVQPNRFLTKPYHAKELVDMVEAVLAG
jgi:two-component system, cell cycle sensor histidine kinase and response regulator CckA